MTTTRRRPQRPKLATTTITSREDITHDLWKVWIEKPEGFQFKPGQYCTIGVDGIERAYSIVSAPYEDDLELFVELVPPPDGNLTPLLHEIGVGKTVTIRPRAKGIFVLNPTLPNQLFVATVTGVVPYVSILRQYLHDGMSGHNFHVLMGASYANEFAYDEELQRLADEHPEFITFVPTVSRPDEEPNVNWQGEKRQGQYHRRGLRRAQWTDSRGHDRVRLRTPWDDRGRQRPDDTEGIPGRRRAFLEGRLGIYRSA